MMVHTIDRRTELSALHKSNRFHLHFHLLFRGFVSAFSLVRSMNQHLSYAQLVSPRRNWAQIGFAHDHIFITFTPIQGHFQSYQQRNDNTNDLCGLENVRTNADARQMKSFAKSKTSTRHCKHNIHAHFHLIELNFCSSQRINNVSKNLIFHKWKVRNSGNDCFSLSGDRSSFATTLLSNCYVAAVCQTTRE